MSNSFFVFLPSNTDYPNNQPNSFRVRLPKPLHFNGSWVCGLHSITYPYSWPATIGTLDDQWIAIQVNDPIQKCSIQIRMTAPKGSHKNVEGLRLYIKGTLDYHHGRVQAIFNEKVPSSNTDTVRRKRALEQTDDDDENIIAHSPKRVNDDEEEEEIIAHSPKRVNDDEPSPDQKEIQRSREEAPKKEEEEEKKKDEEKKRDEARKREQQILAQQREIATQRMALNTENQRLAADKQKLIDQQKSIDNEKQRLAEQQKTINDEKQKLVAEKEKITKEKQNLVAEKQSLLTQKQSLSAQQKTNRKQEEEANERINNAQKELETQQQSLSAQQHALAAQQQELDAKKNELNLQKETLTAKEQRLNKQQQELFTAQEEFEAQQKATALPLSGNKPYERMPTPERIEEKEMHIYPEHCLLFDLEKIDEMRPGDLAIIMHVLDSITIDYLPEFERFRVSFADPSIQYISFSPQLGYVLGFENPQIVENNEIAKYGSDLRGGFSSFAVYLNNITENMIIGNSLSSLLRVVSVGDAKPGDYVEKIYDSVIYARVLQKEIQEIQVELRTLHNGKLVPFSYGTVLLVLIFKKVINF